MTTYPRGKLLIAAVAVTLATLGVLAQGGIKQLGLDEATAGRQFVDGLRTGQPAFGAAVAAFKALPAAARGPAVDAAVAWARAYMASAPFRAAYTKAREELKPPAPNIAPSFEAEMKMQIEEMKKAMADLPAAARPTMEAAIKEMTDRMAEVLKDPEQRRQAKEGWDAQLAAAKEAYAAEIAQWEDEYPAEPRRLLARRLRAFLEASEDVNFSAAVATKQGVTRFTDPEYETKPLHWKMCFRAGKDAVTAARAATKIWLSELDRSR